MYRNIYTHINDSLEDRSIHIINQIASQNRHYGLLTGRILDLQNEILNLLSEDSQSLFFDYEILLGDRDSIKNLLLYKQGVIDGINIKTLVSSNCEKNCKIFNGGIYNE